MTDGETYFFSETWTEDLETDREGDAGIICWRGTPDRDNESWQSCE
jgi:hypothetical protein